MIFDTPGVGEKLTVHELARLHLEKSARLTELMQQSAAHRDAGRLGAARKVLAQAELLRHELMALESKSLPRR